MRIAYKDRIGQKFNKLLILDFEKGYKHSRFLCRCDCGTEKMIDCDSVVLGKQKSCGCEKRKETFEDLTGKQYGRLTVKCLYSNLKYKRIWRCECVCGSFVNVYSENLKSGHTQSCGCYQAERAKESHEKHGKSRTRLYKIHLKMKARCYNEKTSRYANYGGRGIKICEEWLNEKNGFENFYTWAITHGYSDNLSIDRINVNGNYEPKNCRWADDKEQSRNRTDNRFISYNGETRCISDWCEKLNIPQSTVINRLNRGLSVDKVLSKKRLLVTK